MLPSVRAWAIALVIACGPSAQPRTVTNKVAPPQAELVGMPRKVAVPRPELELAHLVPDFHDELRWPLSAMTHPNLEPQFNIAAVFAQPGVGWIDLCKRGAHHRSSGRDRDQLQYLRGWCAALQGDVDAACGRLAPLVGSTVSGMSAAVRIDIANILVNHGGAEKAEHWLTRHRIDDPALLDTLAATYADVGNARDAYEINRRVMASDSYPTAATKCRRLVKDIVLSGVDYRMVPINDLKDLATKPKIPDETCLALHDAIQCWDAPGRSCTSYLIDQSVDARYATLLAIMQSWPTGSASYNRWESLAADSVSVMQLEGAADVAITALEAALRASESCSAELASLVDVARSATQVTELAPRVRVLANACQTSLPTLPAAH